MEKPEPLVKNSDPASYTREKDVPRALICVQGKLAGHCLILVKYPTGDDVNASTPAGPNSWRIQQQQSTTNAQVRSKLYMCLEDCKDPEVSEQVKVIMTSI